MEKIIIYGAGGKGKTYLKFLEEYGLDTIVSFFCDERANEIKTVGSIPVIPYDEAITKNIRFLVGVQLKQEVL